MPNDNPAAPAAPPAPAEPAVAVEGSVVEIPPGESEMALELWEKVQKRTAVQQWLAPKDKKGNPLKGPDGKPVPPKLKVRKA
jgi:P pilus assembly chaperone PapD